MNTQNQNQKSYVSPANQRETIKTFETTTRAGSVCGVEVTGIPGRPGTFSLSVFTRLANGGSGRFLRPELRVENGVATVETVGLVFARLLDEACLFIQDQAQADSDAFIERKQRRELKGEFKEKPKQGLGAFSSPSTPEERAKEKQKREANMAARRAADQAQRQKMRGK